jgi:hypothetical protein
MDKLNQTNKKINIGVACSGNRNNVNDKNRSMDLSFFEPLTNKASLFLIQRISEKKTRIFSTNIQILNF